MRLGWWTSEHTDFNRLMLGSPKHAISIFNSWRAAGHEVTLNHVPRGLPNERVEGFTDTGPYASAWAGDGFEIHKQILQLVRTTGSFDPMNRAQRALRAWMDSSEWCGEFDPRPDVQVVHPQPCVSITAKLEAAHAILRSALAGIPTILLDQDYSAGPILNTLQDLFTFGEGGRWDRRVFADNFWIFSPYVRRMYARQIVTVPTYNKESERPLSFDEGEPSYVFGYVGNDYQREELLGKFYKRQHADGIEVANAIWGRWKLDEPYKRQPDLIELIGREAFHGMVPPGSVHDCYRKCAASIVIAHRGFYGPKLIAYRWLELPESGRLMFVDANLHTELGLIEDRWHVAGPEEARVTLEKLEAHEYWDEVHAQRTKIASHPLTQPSWWVTALAALGSGGTELDFYAHRPEFETNMVYEI